MNFKKTVTGYNIRFTGFLMLCASVIALHAQTRDQIRRAQVDSVLAARYFRTPYDTAYVTRPEGKLTLKVRFNQTGNSFHAKGTVNDVYCKVSTRIMNSTSIIIAVV